MAKAAVVKRIFVVYAQGVSPRAIAKQLNRDGVPGPSGKGWGPSTIHGNWQRGTGILNNELYIGKQVWDSLRHIEDAQTGKRISRLNSPSEWNIREVPELRIIDQELWDPVKARQEALQGNRSRGSGPGYWDRRRPRYLFTGLMRCGMCGGGVVTWNRLYIGCVNARNNGPAPTSAPCAGTTWRRPCWRGCSTGWWTPTSWRYLARNTRAT
jgi:site-specific DNA recombinase